MLYNKALRSLRKYLNKSIDDEGHASPVIPLLCCVLFYCFESVRGNVDGAMQHLRSGFMILSKEKDKEKGSPASSTAASGEAEDIDLLEQVFYQFDLQATMFDDERMPILLSTPPSMLPGANHLSAGKFTSIGDAQIALTQLQNWLLRFFISNEEYKFWPEEKLPLFIVQKKAMLVEAYVWWAKEFDTYSKESPPHQLQTPAIAVLRIQHLIFNLLLESSLPYDRTIFDMAHTSKHKGTADKIIRLAEPILGCNSHESLPETNSRTLSAENGILHLYFYSR